MFCGALATALTLHPRQLPALSAQRPAVLRLKLCLCLCLARTLPGLWLLAAAGRAVAAAKLEGQIFAQCRCIV